MSLNPFLNADRRLRSGWWIAIFVTTLAGLLLPFIFSAKDANGQVSIYDQILILVAASLICQALARKPFSKLFGPLNWRWPRDLVIGAGWGALLMLAPAFILFAMGTITWTTTATTIQTITPILTLLAAAAATEELLFRGFLFQRLIEGIGIWPAQLAIAALFVLTHSDALREIGPLAYLAGANIFLASILFGLAYVRTQSLAMPLGLHFAANVVQGPILGFGVSGDEQPGLLAPTFDSASDWLTGGAFGLEASVPGIMCVLVLLVVFLRGKTTQTAD